VNSTTKITGWTSETTSTNGFRTAFRVHRLKLTQASPANVFVGTGEEDVVERRRADVEPGHGQPPVAQRDQQVGPVLPGCLGGHADPVVGSFDGRVGERVDVAGDPGGPLARVGAVVRRVTSEVEFHVEQLGDPVLAVAPRDAVGLTGEPDVHLGGELGSTLVSWAM
jgi:hypothetical protein